MSQLYISYVYVLQIKIVLYFLSILHVILTKSVELFFFLELFWSSVRNENTCNKYCKITSDKDFLNFSTAKITKQNKDYTYNNFGGECPSGLRCCDQNQKAPGSNFTRLLLEFTQPCYKAPSDLQIEIVKNAVINIRSLENGPKLNLYLFLIKFISI